MSTFLYQFIAFLLAKIFELLPKTLTGHGDDFKFIDNFYGGTDIRNEDPTRTSMAALAMNTKCGIQN
jgi:hypothetical protein